MDVPHEADFGNEGNQNDDQNGEELRLVIQDGDGLGRSADAGEPIELAGGHDVATSIRS